MAARPAKGEAVLVKVQDDDDSAAGGAGGGGSRRPPVRILLVDDNDDFRRQAARFLAAEPGCNVVAFAASGDEAVELAKRIGPDLILMDVSMPGINGFEAARRIKALAGAPRVVIVTLDGGVPYRTASELALADGFLSKADFIREIRPLLEQLFPSSSGESEAEAT
jgi:DNA-binding NarL/FixJ family response regulator